MPHIFGRLDPATGSAILTFTGTYAPRSGSLWLSDVSHHHLALGIVALLLSHMLSVASLPRMPISSVHFDLAVGLAALGTASSFAAGHLGAFTPYAFLANDLVAQAALYTHHQYIGGFFMCGAFAHGAIFLVRDSGVGGSAIGFLVANRSAVVSLLSFVCLFLGFHTLGLYVHNDVMQALGSPEKQLALLPVFAEWLQLAHGSHLGTTLTAGDFLVHHAIALGLHTTTLVLVKAAVNSRSSKHQRRAVIVHLNWVCIFLGFHSFGLYIHNDTVSALGRAYDQFSDQGIVLLPVFARCIQSQLVAPAINGISTDGAAVRIAGRVLGLGTADTIVHHVHAFTIHVTALILLKGLLFARGSRLVPDKARLGFRFPCDGPGRGGTCQVSAWDHIFLGLFWMYNAVSVVVFHFSWKIQSDVWANEAGGGIRQLTARNFAN